MRLGSCRRRRRPGAAIAAFSGFDCTFALNPLEMPVVRSLQSRSPSSRCIRGTMMRIPMMTWRLHGKPFAASKCRVEPFSPLKVQQACGMHSDADCATKLS